MSGDPCPKVIRPPKVHKTLQRKALKRKTRKRDNEFSPSVRRVVEIRSGGRCEAKTPSCLGVASHHHHRQLRSQGGPGTAANDLHCCSACHLYIHSHAALSYAHGWMVRGSSAVDKEPAPMEPCRRSDP